MAPRAPALGIGLGVQSGHQVGRPPLQRCLTPRSNGPPTACHLGREAVLSIIGLAAKASHRWRPFNSNVRPHSSSMKVFEAFKSFFTAMKASAAFGRAQRLNVNGQHEAALEVALTGLSLLRAPYVNLASAPEGSALVSLAVFAEQSAASLGREGPPQVDLETAATLLESIVAQSGDENPTAIAQLAYIKTRIAARVPSAA